MTEAQVDPPLCPLLTTVQIVPRAFAIGLVPKPVPVPGATNFQAALKGGGFEPPKTAYAYEGEGVFMVKTPEGTPKDHPDPPLQADTLVVPCQEGACRFWCNEQKDCRLVAGSPAVALASARQLLNKAHENYEDNTEEGVDPPAQENAT